jgi:hypothetical protein
MNPLLIALTNLVTVVQLPAGLCFDLGVMGASFDTHDTRPLYGLRLSALDARGAVIAEGWVQECYVPPMTETVPVLLTPETVAVQCEVFGVDLAGKWTDAYFAVYCNPPRLSIRALGQAITVAWSDPQGCWQLEANTEVKAAWQPSSATVLATNSATLFRLSRP